MQHLLAQTRIQQFTRVFTPSGLSGEDSPMGHGHVSVTGLGNMGISRLVCILSSRGKTGLVFSLAVIGDHTKTSNDYTKKIYVDLVLSAYFLRANCF